jgi:two-component system nitrogen regulation response regulator GlnG
VTAADPNALLLERMSARFVAESPAMQAVRSAMAEVAEGDGPLLLEGEPGVGKEYLARLIHLQSRRAGNVFETLLPPALPIDLAADELLGLQARKLRLAARGTLLLKEVWRLPLQIQERIAHSLGLDSDAPGTPIEVYDVRLMISSRVELEDASQEGLLSSPVVSTGASPWRSLRRILVPPLRRRPTDLPRLVEVLGAEIARALSREPLVLPPRTLDRFLRYAWPGNLSELRAVLFRLATTLPGPTVEEQHLDGLLPQVNDEIPIDRFGLEDLVRAKLRSFLDRIRGYHVEDLHSQVLGQVERPLLELILEHTRGNQLQAARLLGINRNTLRKRIQALGIRINR